MLEGPRALRVQEFDALMELVDDTFRGPDWPRPTKPKLYSLLLNPQTNLEGMRVFVADGRPISHFGFYIRDVFCGELRLRVASVGSVCTHPDYRGRGLATQLVEEALHLCEQQGVHIMLISGGRGLYRRQGSTDVGEMLKTTLTQQDLPSGAHVRIEPWSDSVLPHCARMYQRETFRFYRSLQDWSRVVRSGTDMNRDVDTFLIYEEDALRAYAAVYAPKGNESGFLEYGGSRYALWSAIPNFFERYALERFVLHIPSDDLEWQSLCRERVMQHTTIPDHTARIVSVPALVAAIQPHLMEILGEELVARMQWTVDPPYRVQSPEGLLEIPDIPMLTQLILGPHTLDIRQRLQSAGRLGEKLLMALPLPFNFPGLNFV